jgi:hypothetical protein
MNESRKKYLEVFKDNYRKLREAGYDSAFATENKAKKKDIIKKLIEEIQNGRNEK